MEIVITQNVFREINFLKIPSPPIKVFHGHVVLYPSYLYLLPRGKSTHCGRVFVAYLVLSRVDVMEFGLYSAALQSTIDTCISVSGVPLKNVFPSKISRSRSVSAKAWKMTHGSCQGMKWRMMFTCITSLVSYVV